MTDPETGEEVDKVDDVLLDDMTALSHGERTDTLRVIPGPEVSLRAAVPIYYDQQHDERFRSTLAESAEFADFSSITLGDMVQRGMLSVRRGHGSPSQDQRVGDVPYIKVSDLRAGFVNINPTNRIPAGVAKGYWRGEHSGLQAFDLLTPERTSKNIGDFCVLMPGQEQVVLTKEILVLRPDEQAEFDPFYLMWALTLSIVRDQWKRIIFMQTNREDVGKRYLEIRMPLPPSREAGEKVSAPFRNYYRRVAETRTEFSEYLDSAPGRHHFFVSGAESP